MAALPLPQSTRSLPPVASAEIKTSTVAPTVGPGKPGYRSAAGPFSPTRRPFATGRLLADSDGLLHLQPDTYIPASAPITHAICLPIGSINVFVGFTGTVGVTDDPNAYVEPVIRSASHSPEPADQAADPPLRAPSPPGEDQYADAFADDADSATVSDTGSIVAASHTDSIVPVENPEDYGGSLEDLLGYLSDPDSGDFAPEGPITHHAVLMTAPEVRNETPDPFKTPIAATATAAEIESARVTLEAAREKEAREREKFRLEKEATALVSDYRQKRMESRIAGTTQGRAINFDTPGADAPTSAAAAAANPNREVEVRHDPAPGASNRPNGTAGTPATGAPPPPEGRPPAGQPRMTHHARELDANGLPLWSTPMDNVIAGAASLATVPAQGEHALQISYAQNCLAKVLQQQAEGRDSEGRCYTRSTNSRAASSGNRLANRQNCPPPQPRPQQARQDQPQPDGAANSSNGPRPHVQLFTADGRPVDARTYLAELQAWHARQPHDARHSMNSQHDAFGSLSRAGPACFGPMIRHEQYPIGFRSPKEITKYDPKEDPTTWIDTYLMAMGIAGHTDLLAARFLPMMMEGPTRQWFNTLPADSIDSWEDMRNAFIQHFQGSYTRSTTTAELERCVQGYREPTSKWLRRWYNLWINATNIHPEVAIKCFKDSCRYKPLVAKIKRLMQANKTITLPQLIEVGWRYAAEDTEHDDDGGSSSKPRSSQHNAPPPRQDHRDNRVTGKRPSGFDLVANTGYGNQRDSKTYRRDGGGYRDGGGSRANNAPNNNVATFARPRFAADATLNEPCILHSRPGRPSTHSTYNCYTLQQIDKARREKENAQQPPAPQPANQNNGGDPNGFGRAAGSLHTFTGVGTRREKKVLTRAVAVHSVSRVDIPRYLDWSEHDITWSRADHAPAIEYPGRVALVVRPKVCDYWLPKTLMDGGSSINILYTDTFRRLGLPHSAIEPTGTTFHGIVPGRKAYPIGKVALPVTFGTPANYRTERIYFELVDFKSPYHCVLGRQAFAKFMAVSHYAYNMLKIPGPGGVITIHGDPDMALECEENGAKMADAVIAEETDKEHELSKFKPVDPNDPAILKKPLTEAIGQAAFGSTSITRQIDLTPGDSSQQVTVGANLSPA